MTTDVNILKPPNTQNKKKQKKPKKKRKKEKVFSPSVPISHTLHCQAMLVPILLLAGLMASSALNP